MSWLANNPLMSRATGLEFVIASGPTIDLG